MYEKNNVKFIYRIICLVTFIVALLSLNNYVTSIMLLIIFFIIIHRFSNYFFSFLAIISFVLFIISFILNNYSLLNFLVIIDYSYYFLSISNSYEMDIDDEEIDLTDDELIRFREERKDVRKGLDIVNTKYLTFHLGILFLTIVVGSCVI